MSVEDLGRAEGGETVIRIYCVFSKTKHKGKRKRKKIEILHVALLKLIFNVFFPCFIFL